jgi:dTMP kinase
VETVIQPALAAGVIVVADRYADSTMAYQAFGMGADRDDVQVLIHVATRNLQPDVTFYVDVLPEIGLGRIAGRTHANRLDIESLAFHHRVRDGYRLLIAEGGARWHVIDGSASPDDVHRSIMKVLEPLLARLEQTG